MNHRLFLILITGLLVSPAAQGEWTYSEKLHLILGPDIVEAGARYETFYGEGAVQVGARAQGVLDSKDEDAWSALGLLNVVNEYEAWTVGAGFQQRDPSVQTSPLVELAVTPWYNEHSRTQLYGQYEWDGVGAGIGVRLEWMANITTRLDADMYLDVSWFEELEEDVDGYGAVFIEPSAELDVLHLGPAIWIDEEEVALGFMLMVRP